MTRFLPNCQAQDLDFFFEAWPCLRLSVELCYDLVFQFVVSEHACKERSHNDCRKGQSTNVTNEVERSVDRFLNISNMGVQVKADGEPVTASGGPAHDLGPLHVK